MAEISNEVLVEELLKIDARLEQFANSVQELATYSRETVKQVAEAHKEARRLELTLACRHLDRTDAAL